MSARASHDPFLGFCTEDGRSRCMFADVQDIIVLYQISQGLGGFKLWNSYRALAFLFRAPDYTSVSGL